MNHENKPINLKEILDSSTLQLTSVTLEKLRSARTHALDHQRTLTSPVLSWASSHIGFNHSLHLSKSTNLALTLIFVACLFTGISYWQNYNKESDVDIAILTDDMPIHVFLD